MFAGDSYIAGWIMSVVGAMVLLLLYRSLFHKNLGADTRLTRLGIDNRFPIRS